MIIFLLSCKCSCFLIFNFFYCFHAELLVRIYLQHFSLQGISEFWHAHTPCSLIFPPIELSLHVCWFFFSVAITRDKHTLLRTTHLLQRTMKRDSDQNTGKAQRLMNSCCLLFLIAGVCHSFCWLCICYIVYDWFLSTSYVRFIREC